MPGATIQPASVVVPKTQAIEVGPAAQHAREAGSSNEIGERIRRIGQDEDQRVRRDLESRGRISLNTPTFVSSSPEPPSRIGTVRCATAFLIRGRLRTPHGD
jgi:hypothetical protein